MKMQKVSLFISVLLGISIYGYYVTSPVAAKNAAGATTATFLEIGTGARARALGEAYTALADDVFGLHYNPAGIAQRDKMQAGLMHLEFTQNRRQEYGGFSLPLRSNEHIAFNVVYSNLGKVERTTLSSVQSGVSLESASAYAFSLEGVYAIRIPAYSLYIGGGAKVIHEKLDDIAASGIAVDLGLLWKSPVKGLTLGTSVANVGTKLKFFQDREDIPLTYRLGTSYKTYRDMLIFSLDMSWIREQDVEVHFGSEYNIDDFVYFRGGFTTATDIGAGVSAGLGVRWHNFKFDYAYSPFGKMGNTHWIDLEITSGKARKEGKTPEEKKITHAKSKRITKSKQEKIKIPKPEEPAEVKPPKTKTQKPVKSNEELKVYLGEIKNLTGFDEGSMMVSTLKDIISAYIENTTLLVRATEPGGADIKISGWVKPEEITLTALMPDQKEKKVSGDTTNPDDFFNKLKRFLLSLTNK